jgi:hypothetical protein
MFSPRQFLVPRHCNSYDVQVHCLLPVHPICVQQWHLCARSSMYHYRNQCWWYVQHGGVGSDSSLSWLDCTDVGETRAHMHVISCCDKTKEGGYYLLLVICGTNKHAVGYKTIAVSCRRLGVIANTYYSNNM